MKVLMVCLGNICRSPMAEGILRHKAKERYPDIVTDSAGTSDFHAGEAPDRRAIACLRSYGIEISDLRARPFETDDFHHFDLIYAMDAENLRDIRKLAPSSELAEKAQLIMSVTEATEQRSVPDPWYGDMENFHYVYRMLDPVMDSLLDELTRQRAKG